MLRTGELALQNDEDSKTREPAVEQPRLPLGDLSKDLTSDAVTKGLHCSIESLSTCSTCTSADTKVYNVHWMTIAAAMNNECAS